MKFSSALAIYALFWSLAVFLVLPFRPSTPGEDVHVPGQADGAPPRFSPGKAALYTTIVASVMFGLYYLNYVNGWIGPEVLDFFTPRPVTP